MQTGFDFTGLKEQLGDGFAAFVDQWQRLQQTLAARGRGIIDAGRILTAMTAAYGAEFMARCLEWCHAPTVRQATALKDAYEFFGDAPLSDDEAAVLDSLCYRRMRRDLRLQAFRWIRDGKTAQMIEDLLDSIPAGPPRAPDPVVTEDDVRRWYGAVLEQAGWTVRMEQPTKDGGAVDIVARRGDKLMIAECKVTLDRAKAIEALGQLVVYSQSFPTTIWHVAYFNHDDRGDAVAKVCHGKVKFHKVTRSAHAEVAP